MKDDCRKAFAEYASKRDMMEDVFGILSDETSLRLFIHGLPKERSDTVMLENFIEKVKNKDLTTAEGQILDFILEKGSGISFMTAKQVAKEVGTTDTTVIRCCRSLGYDGFLDLKKAFQNHLSPQGNNDPGRMMEIAKRFDENCPISQKATDTLCSLFDSTNQNIRQTIDNNTIDKFVQIADLLIGGKRKYIVGFRSCAAMVAHFARLLRYSLDGVSVVSDEGRAVFEQMLDINKKDIVIIFSLKKYEESDLVAMNIAKSHGAKVCVITDQVAAPLARDADILIIINTKGCSFFHSHMCNLFVIEFILTLVSNRQESTVKTRLEQMDNIMTKI